MTESLERIEATPVIKEFDKKAFSRQYLKEFLKQDPYVRTSEDSDFEFGTGSPDLDQIYHIGLSILASDANVPIDFEFTELAPSHEPMEPSDVEDWLVELQRDLILRSQMVGQVFGSLAPGSTGPAKPSHTLQSITSASRQEKGRKLEELVASIFENEFEVRRNSRQSDQEIDILVINRLNDPFWTALQSPLILVECRNRKKKVEAKEIRDFEIKLQNRAGMCKLGLVVSPSGFTCECRTIALRASRESYRILLIGSRELTVRMEGTNNTARWIEDLLLDQG